MDYYKNVWYHGNIKEENPFLMLLAASTKEEMETISRGDKTMEEIRNKVDSLNEDRDVLDVIIENEDEIISNSLYEAGIKQGKSEGIAQGKSERNIEIAKKMIDKGMDKKEVQELTGLSLKEISDI